MAEKKKNMMDEIINEIRKTIFTPKAETAETKPDSAYAMPEGTAKTIDARNKAVKEAADAADGKGYKKGGMVKKTGKALVHKGEAVLTTKQVSKMKKALKTAGCK